MKGVKILIVEDEDDIRELIHFHFYKEQYEVFEASNGDDAVELALVKKPALIVLDIMIPGMDGLEVCKTLKEKTQTKDIKIIFLSAKGEEEDIVKGLELGADDYISKPFSPKILMARVRSVLRRDLEQEKKKGFMINGIELDEPKRKVLINKKEIALTASEFLILKFLISSPGHVYTRGQIVNNVKGYNHAVTDRSIDTQLVSLRKKMGEKGSLIETVWGVGYRFSENATLEE